MILKALFISVLALVVGCSSDDVKTDVPTSGPIAFNDPERVQVIGYDDHIMEPFLSRDGTLLFFNNLNDPAVNTNIHYATRIDDLTFQYNGELPGLNTESLEGVATMDASSRFYFVSTRSYDQTFSTIYSGTFNGEAIENVGIVPGISLNQGGWVNFDVEVSSDGNFLYFADGRYDQNGGPYEADLVLATKTDDGFQRSGRQDVLAYVNTDALEYAACISEGRLELYFTRITLPLRESSLARIYLATRDSVDEPFQDPFEIEEMSGFVEAATISPDGQIIYYHKKEDGEFVLYMVRKE